MKHAESGLATFGAIVVLLRRSVYINKSPKGIINYTYNGPGMMLAVRISEYGMIIIGFVGNARNGC
jgi:hypothetical protein